MRRDSRRAGLNYWRDSWPLLVELCPCDLHFVEFLEERNVAGKSIFHFGSGEHHLLGTANLKAGEPNEILAITASRREHSRYVDRIIRTPALSRRYKVLFADIYTLTPGMLPRFDYATLFHLCEFYKKEQASYAALDDASLVSLFLEKIRPGGRLAFYRGSDGFEGTRRILQRFVKRGELVLEERFKTLDFYRPAGR